MSVHITYKLAYIIPFIASAVWIISVTAEATSLETFAILDFPSGDGVAMSWRKNVIQ